MKKVVVTGYGAVSPSGIGIDSLFDSIFSGKSMISCLNLDLEGIGSKVGGFCNFDWTTNGVSEIFENKRDFSRMDKFISMAILAFEESLKISNLKQFFKGENFKKEKVGVLIGSGIGGIGLLSQSSTILETQGPKRISPFTIPYSISNMASSVCAMRYDLRGPTFSIASACASATHSIAVGYEMIKTGLLDIVFVGGTEAPVNKLGMASFDAMNALSKKYNETPELASRPLDKARDGFVMSEGAGCLVLESEEFAKRRKAKIYSEVKSVSMGSLVSHITSPDEKGEGAAFVMNELITKANLNKKDIDVINMHATSTMLGDEIEVKAIKLAFGDYAKNPILSATKSITGHMLGAIGAIEAIICSEMINRSEVPANLNLIDPIDEAIGMNISSKPQKRNSINHVISNSFGFGGTNAGILLSKYQN